MEQDLIEWLKEKCQGDLLATSQMNLRPGVPYNIQLSNCKSELRGWVDAYRRLEVITRLEQLRLLNMINLFVGDCEWENEEQSIQ